MASILLSAYACEPCRGSEPGVGWNWATELAQLGHQVTVITRTANRTAIEQEKLRVGGELNFIYYDLPAPILHWRKRLRAQTLYYVLWQWFATRRVRQLFPALPFDLVHHITYVSARYPSFMGSLGIPFWFGPVSGGEAVPASLRPGFSPVQRFREWLRDISNRMVPLDPFMRRTFRRAERILVTRDTLPLVPKHWREKTAIQLGIGLPHVAVASAVRHSRPDPEALRLLYVGRLLEWKGVDIALLAVSRIKRVNPRIRLTIVGQGPARAKLEAFTCQLGLEDTVQWVGWQPQWRLAEYYRAADALLFPSLRDSGGMVVLEALAQGLPVVCTDLGGPGVIVDATCGRVLRTRGRRQHQLAEELASALEEIARSPDLLTSLSFGARVRARQFHFHDLAKSIYADVPVDRMVGQA
jgi:glycosyltransferase involved in cell wall biosynthesis